MASISVTGVNLHYEVAGDGKPIICVHGVLGSGRCWKHLMAALEREGGYKVYALDLRGYGDSDKPPEGYNMPTFVEDLRGFMDSLEIPRAILVGQSLGEIIVLSFASKYPERIDRLILVGNAAHVPKTLKIRLNAFLSPLLFLMRRVLMRRLARLFFTNVNEKTQADFDEYCAECMKTTLRSQVRSLKAGMVMDLREDLRRLDVPVLAIFAAQDRLVPLAQAEVMRGCITSGTVKVIQDSGHMPMLEQPEEFNRIVLDFLREDSA